MSQKIEQFLEKFIFNSRWLLAPFFLGLVVSIVLLFIKFPQELTHLVVQVFNASESEVIIVVLALVDMTLIGSLLLMIIFSGYEIFVSKIDVGDHSDRPDWMGKVDFSGLKLKVIGAIVAISAIGSSQNIYGDSWRTKRGQHRYVLMEGRDSHGFCFKWCFLCVDG